MPSIVCENGHTGNWSNGRYSSKPTVCRQCGGRILKRCNKLGSYRVPGMTPRRARCGLWEHEGDHLMNPGYRTLERVLTVPPEKS